MRLFILLASILLGLPATAQTQLTMNDLMATPIRIRGVDCALFPAAALLDTSELHTARVEPRRFKLTPQQIEIVEKQFAEKGLAAIARSTFPEDSILILIRSNAALSHINNHLAVYRRQYYGFYNTLHQPCLYINFLEEPVSGWLYNHIMVMDGGAAFWRISYNIVTHQFYGFSLNGEA
ncbi:MAG: hypothetical protein EOO60_13540 [Hymenobacter sp.]|nr:MAG: hypothetical protein EOO60_13540 [Hymenobacter sp.]